MYVFIRESGVDSFALLHQARCLVQLSGQIRVYGGMKHGNIAQGAILTCMEQAGQLVYSTLHPAQSRRQLKVTSGEGDILQPTQ